MGKTQTDLLRSPCSAAIISGLKVQFFTLHTHLKVYKKKEERQLNKPRIKEQKKQTVPTIWQPLFVYSTVFHVV